MSAASSRGGNEVDVDDVCDATGGGEMADEVEGI